MNHLLTIAGSDCSGGAGLQADLKTFAAFGAYGMSAVTAVTVQNTCGVRSVQDIRPDIVAGQINAVFEDIRVDGVKIGMLSQPEIIAVVAERLRFFKAAPVVLDPVMVATSGATLLASKAVAVLVDTLFPLATLITPNIPEAEALTGRAIGTLSEMESAARQICDSGAAMVLIKGGHRAQDATDILFDGVTCHRFAGEKIATRHTHGTGCTLAAAITALLAAGSPPQKAVAMAKQYVAGCIRHAPGIGKGAGPLNHIYARVHREEPHPL